MKAIKIPATIRSTHEIQSDAVIFFEAFLGLGVVVVDETALVVDVVGESGAEVVVESGGKVFGVWLSA